MDNTAYATEIEDEVEAESYARIRNGLVVEVTGKVGKMVDYYRRDPEGNPLPVKKVKPGQPASRFRIGGPN
jgi:hypothetical protein